MSDDFNALTIGQRIQEERDRLGLSKVALAEHCGVRREMIGRYENGEALPGAEVLAKFLSVGADVTYILTGVRTPPKPAINESGAEYRTVTSREARILDLLDELGEEGLTQVQSIAEKEKRLQELEALAASGGKR